MKLSLIVAMDVNGTIGKDGDIPWRQRADMLHFKQLTTGKPVIMGRKTWESLPSSLPARHNIVLTRDPKYFSTKDGPKPKIVHTPMDALSAAVQWWGYQDPDHGSFFTEPEIMIIGGMQVYRLFLPLADHVYLTLIDATVPGDAFFDFDTVTGPWAEYGESRSFEPDKDNQYPYTFEEYRRKW